MDGPIARSRAFGRPPLHEDGVHGVRGAEARSERRAAPAVGRPARRPAHGAPGLARLVRVAHRGVSAEVTRVAAVDLGTNTTRLLVADVDDGRVDEVSLRQQITRLGEDVHARRRLLPLPIARVRNVLTDYRREAESLGAERVLAVATSAVRDAENGEAFLGEIEWSYGFTTRLLSGDEEAALTLHGVGEVANGTLVLDVGGGSTELITRERARQPRRRLGAADRAASARTSTRSPATCVRCFRDLAPSARRRRRRHGHVARGARPRARGVRPRARARPRAHARAPWTSSSRGSRRCRSRSGGACLRSIPGARP